MWEKRVFENNNEEIRNEDNTLIPLEKKDIH